MSWEIPFNGACGDQITLTPSTTGNDVVSTVVSRIYARYICTLSINTFTSSVKEFDPSVETVQINASFSDEANWTLSIAGKTFSGTGASVSVSWDGKDNYGQVVAPRLYDATLNIKNKDGDCSDTRNIPITVLPSCNLKITDFTGTSKIIDPSSGGNIGLSGSISDDSGKPVNWSISIAGGTYSGTGLSPSITWDGKDGNGKIVEPGTYAATLTAQTDDGKCSDTKTIPFTVETPPDNSCGLYVDFGSSAHVASGNLSHSQTLFFTKGGSLALGMTLFYNSLDPVNAALGRGWSHNYAVKLRENADGSVLISEGNWKYQFFTLSNGTYVPKRCNYASLIKNADNSFTLTRKDGTRYNFTTAGAIGSIIDRNGNAVSFSYTNGNLTTVTDPAGHITTLTYDADNHLSNIIDPAGNWYILTYSNNTLASVINPDGGQWSYSYAGNIFMLSKTDPQGNTTTYGYDDQRRVIYATDPEGKTRSIAYPQGSDTAKTTTFTEKDGGVWQYRYDTQAGTLLSKTDPQGGITSYTYDVNGNRTSITLPDGTATSSTYDAKGNMLTATDALGQTTTYGYNDFGQVTSITDPQDGVTSYVYDAAGNMTAMTDPSNATTNYEYDAKGNVTKTTDAAGQATSFAYDNQGNLASVTDAGATTNYAYDAAGNAVSITDPNDAVIRYAYDANNRLIKTIDQSGNESFFIYDLNGNKLSQTDANGNTARYEYNYKGQLVKTTDFLGNITTYSYGNTGCPSCGGGVDKLVSLTDAGGNSTKYEYDQLGRLITETDPLSNTTSYRYDAKGNLTAKIDANGDTIAYSYDGNGRLLKKSYPDNSEESYSYDAKGNMLTATNKEISYSFSYDTAGRMTSATDPNGKTIQYVYDSAGRKTQTTYPEGSVVSYAYDIAGRLSIITNGGGRTYGYSYDSLGRRTSLTYPNGATAAYSYDMKGNLTSLSHKTSTGKTIADFSYTHDKVGNRLTKVEPQVTWNYGYDKIYRLLQALPDNRKGHEHHQGVMVEQYSYDPTGNRLTGPHKHDSYSYGPGNELLTDRRLSYSYDKNGNQIGKTKQKNDHDKDGQEDKHHDEELSESANWTYSYDYENRLIKAETGHGHEKTILTFKYDPLGRRIEKKVKKSERGRTEELENHRYVYDDQAIILEYETRHEEHKEKTHVTKYVHGPGIDEHLSMERRGEVLFYHADGLGSTVALSDKRQKVVEIYEYDSFGNLKNGMKPSQPFTYTGREWDKETGLYYYRARYYDPMDGRFISEDPIPLENRTQDQLNSYTYAVNNPINFTDPNGQNIYGNWCGPGGSGPTKDGVDAICKKHDNCFNKSGATWKDNVLGTKDKNKEQCIDDCNKDLCNDLRNYFPKTYSEIFGRSAVMIFFRCSN